ncbi:tetratricopeptide repeat protein, partial [Actinomyces oris]
MADPISLFAMSASLAGLLMRGAAVAVDPSWSSAASLPGEAVNTWRSIWSLMQQARGEQENPLEASIKSRLQKQVDDASERYELAGVAQSALAGAVTEMEVALRELSGDDAAVLEAVRFPDNFETYLRRRTAGHRQNVEAAAEPFFDDLTRIVADEFIRLAPGSRAFNIAALKQLLAGQEQIRAGVEQLQGAQAETHERLTAAATDIQEIRRAVTRNQSALPTRIRFGSRPRVTAGFVKREEQDKLFEAVLTCAEPRTVLTGMRGSGKTQLAATVATRCEEEGWPLVAWIDADSRDTIITNLYNLALQAGIEAPKDVPPETIVQRFLDQLRSADAEDRLFVFDNVENLDDLKGLAPEGDGARIIITTTRHLDWDSLGWFLLTVGIFEREQSIALLCQHTGDAHRDAADQIAEALGDLPVAVAQAAATAKSGRYSLSIYLERLSNHTLEVSISRLEGDDYPDAVGVALFMAYEQALEQFRTKHPQQERIVTSLLDILSLLAASGVPTHWLLALEDDSDAVRDSLSFLKRSSILQESTDGDKTIIHRLQGQVYRETYLSDQENFSEACTNTKTLLNEIDVDRLENFEQQRQETRNLVEQIGNIASQGYSRPLFSDPDFTALLATTLRNATDLGMPHLALALTDSVTRAGDTLGSDHPSTLASRNNLAYAYQDVGKLDEAITLYEQTLEDHTRILGPDHPSTLASRNNLAYAYQDAGRLNDAITLHKQNLEDRTRILGPDHPDTLASRNNLASAYQDAGRLNDAITLYEQTLEDHT